MICRPRGVSAWSGNEAPVGRGGLPRSLAPGASLPLQSAMPSSEAVTVAGRVLEVSGQGEELLFMLFPHLRGLRIGQVEDTGDTVVIRASCRAAQARC